MALLAALLTLGQAPAPTTWEFSPARLDLAKTPVWNLRELNEKRAGQTGWITATKEGDFARGDGEPIRFWAINSGVDRERPFVARPRWSQTPPDLKRHARFLAQRGVNMVRLHLHINPKPEPGVKLTDIQAGERDFIWRSVAAYREEGIYVTLSPYWVVTAPFAKDWLPGGEQPAFGLLFFDPTLQAAYKEWLRKVFLPKNPFTGVPLAQDPSLAIFQIQNEDSLLFWTLDQIKGEQRKALEERFWQFLIGKYSTRERLRQAWEGGYRPEDPTSGDTMPILPAWIMTQNHAAGTSRRVADQVEFLSRLQFDWNREVVRFLREELRCPVLVNAGNWRPADVPRLNDAERWSYTGAQVDAVNRYFGGVHRGANEGWAIQNGDLFTSESALFDPRRAPLALRQTAGRPMLVTESSWVPPAQTRAESAFVVSVMQSLSGIDGYYWFAAGEEGWTPPQSANGYNDSLGKWTCALPDVMGGFPAAAYVWRKGLIKTPSPVWRESRPLAEVFGRQIPPLTEEPGFDPNRDTARPGSGAASVVSKASYAFALGPVQVAFGGASVRPTGVDLNADLASGFLRPAGDEVLWNFRQGYLTVTTPQAVGVAAHFDRTPGFALGDVTVAVTSPMLLSLWVVSLDGQPLRQSRRVLVQVVTPAQPTGWQDVPAQVDGGGGNRVPGRQVVSIGRAPWQVRQAEGSIRLRNPGLRTLTLLDPNLMPLRTEAVTAKDGQISVALPRGAMYAILEG